MHKAIVVTALIVVAGAPARAQYVDPQAMMDRLLLEQRRQFEERRQEDIQRRNLERYYAKLPPGDLIREVLRRAQAS
jgi:hypothetical protein